MLINLNTGTCKRRFGEGLIRKVFKYVETLIGLNFTFQVNSLIMTAGSADLYIPEKMTGGCCLSESDDVTSLP